MNPWPFVTAAYAVAIALTAALLLWCYSRRCAAPKPRPTRCKRK